MVARGEAKGAGKGGCGSICPCDTSDDSIKDNLNGQYLLGASPPSFTLPVANVTEMLLSPADQSRWCTDP